MKFYLDNTPHSTFRVFVTRDILDFPEAVLLLDFLSCWNGWDKSTEKLLSWEFDNNLNFNYVKKALYRFKFELVEVLDW